MWALISPIFSFLSGIAPAISSYFTARVDAETTEYSALTTAQQEVGIAYLQAQSAANSAKVANNTSRAAHIMVYLFGLPAALHWSAVFISATVEPWYPIGIRAPSPVYADAELKIALSFFILAPAMPIVSGIAAALRK